MPTENRSTLRDLFIRLNLSGLDASELVTDSLSFAEPATAQEFYLFCAGYEAAQQHQGEPVFQLRNTVAGDVWRDADKEAYDSAASLAEYKRRVLYTHADPAEVERLRKLSVTNILIDIVPGDGSGHEVYAHSVQDVEDKLGQMGDRIELLESGFNPAEVERLRDEISQCAAMAVMVEEREWAEHVGNGPISSRVEAAFTQLHNELSEARELSDTLRAQLAELVSAVRSINYGPAHAVQVPGDDEPCYPQRKEWIEWLLGLCEAASAEPSAVIDEARDPRDYAIEHAGYLADAANQVLADYQAYSLAQMLENEGGDDGDTELEEAVDSARDDLHEGLANLRSMAYEFRKRRHQAVNAASTEPSAPLPPVEGDMLPPIGSQVLIHLAREDKWVEHTVVGYYAWENLRLDPSVYRVFVRVRDADGCLNARGLGDIRPIDSAAPQQ